MIAVILKNLKPLLLIFLTISVFFYIISAPNKNWWKFPTDGEIYSNPIYYKGLIYFGNNAGKLYAVDLRNGKDKWIFKSGYEIPYSPIVNSGKVFISSTNTLYALNSTNGNEEWRFQTSSMAKFIGEPKISNNLLFIGDSEGTLFALDLKGKLKWKRHSKSNSRLSSFLTDEHVNWFENFNLNNNTVFWAKSSGVIEALSINKGEMRWKFDPGDTISTNVVKSSGKIFFGTKSGKIFGLNQNNGKVVYTKTPINDFAKCLLISEKGISYWKGPELIITYRNAGVMKIDKYGKVIWHNKNKINSDYCPNENSSTLFVINQNVLTALDTKNGLMKWRYKGGHELNHNIFISRVRFTKKVYISDKSGSFIAIKMKSGKAVWSYEAKGPIYTYPVEVGNYFILSSSDGSLHKINKFTGKPKIPILPINKLQVKQDILKVGKNDILELTLNYDDSLLSYPWKDVNIKSVFSTKGRRPIEIYGFYYDKDTWKLRFNPPKKGEWKWVISFDVGGNVWKKSGSFTSTTDTKNTFIRVSKQNQKRITFDKKTVFNALGIQDYIFDKNKNGNPFDDLSIGGIVPTGKINDLSNYLDIYNKKGGFNLYRFGVSNASFSLWEPTSINSEFRLLEGKWLDYFFTELINHNFNIWMTIFGFNIPFSNSMLDIEKNELDEYIKYVIARYGAYVSIWEVSNEAYAPDEVVSFVAEKIKNYDFEKRSISTSWEKPYNTNIDIISPHWYDSELLSDSDIVTINKINNYSDVKKPVIFGEQGNLLANWDPESATRMRVRSWSAFFNESVLIFWNTSDHIDLTLKNPAIDLTNANQYISDEERKYMKILHNFSSGIDISVKKEALTLNNMEVRGYGLLSNKESLGYLYHFINQESPTSTPLEFTLPKSGEIEWIDPTSGKVILKYNVNVGYNYVISPIFYTDMAFKVKFVVK